MAEIGTIAAIGGIVAAVASVAAAGVQTYSYLKQRADEKAQLEDIEDQKTAEAKAAQESADFEERQHRRRIALLQGQLEAKYGASGLDTTAGTPLADEIDLAQQGEMEALMLKRAGRLASADRMFEVGVAQSRIKSIEASRGLTIAGGAISGIGGSSAALSAAYRPTTTSTRGRGGSTYALSNQAGD